MGISDIFNAATSGIHMQRLALEVTGENIANVNTDGYSRQRVVLSTAPVIDFERYSLGTGVRLSAIQRSYDELLQNQITDSNSAYYQNLTRQTALSQIEPLFNEISADGMGQSIQDFFDSWHDLSVRPQGTPERQAVLARAQIMVDSFRQTTVSLKNIQTDANNSLVQITGDISAKLGSIASLNDQIRLSELSTGGAANELRDSRDLVLRELSQKVGISYFEEQDGTVSVNLSNGQQLVSGSSYGTMYTFPDASGNNNIWATTIGNPPPSPANGSSPDRNISTLVNGQIGNQGELGGAMLTRDVIVPEVLSIVNELANVIAREVNDLHKASYGLPDPQSGNVASTGLAFFTENTLTRTSDTSGAGDVISNIDTSGLWVGMKVSGPGIPAGAVITAIPTSDPPSARNSVKISVPFDGSGAAGSTVTFTGVDTATLKVAITKTVDVAAADTDTAVNGEGNNVSALKIAELLNDSSKQFSVGSTSISSYYATIVSSVGLEVQSMNNAVSQGEAYSRQLKTLMDSKSSVSLDEELANMIKYQKAFEGSAKMITTATEMLDTILNLIR